MFIKYLPVNQAFVILFGNPAMPETASIIDLDGQRFFANRAEIRQAIESKGLSLNRDNTITVPRSTVYDEVMAFFSKGELRDIYEREVYSVIQDKLANAAGLVRSMTDIKNAVYEILNA